MPVSQTALIGPVALQAFINVHVPARAPTTRLAVGTTCEQLDSVSVERWVGNPVGDLFPIAVWNVRA